VSLFPSFDELKELWNQLTLSSSSKHSPEPFKKLIELLSIMTANTLSGAQNESQTLTEEQEKYIYGTIITGICRRCAQSKVGPGNFADVIKDTLESLAAFLSA
jgi:hypothetical protein